LHANCCPTNNNDTTECYNCGNQLGCTTDEYNAYCHRWDPGDNLWQQFHRGWVEAQCGSPAQSDGSVWYCTIGSTCTTYTCPL